MFKGDMIDFMVLREVFKKLLYYPYS
jgi:hypothetical protein